MSAVGGGVIVNSMWVDGVELVVFVAEVTVVEERSTGSEREGSFPLIFLLIMNIVDILLGFWGFFLVVQGDNVLQEERGGKNPNFKVQPKHSFGFNIAFYITAVLRKSR